MSFFLILKLLVVGFFLVMFLRGSRLVWGVGLLTVSTAVLLDAVLSTFGREEMAANLGFFFYVITGALFAGAAIWLWGLLRPITSAPVAGGVAHSGVVPTIPHPPRRTEAAGHRGSEPTWSEPRPADSSGTAFDRQMLFNQIRYRFSPDDVLDLIFDLGMNENDVIGYDQDMAQVIINVIDQAEERGQTGTLALAVERILTPLPPDHLPRLEKLTPDSPPIVLRQYVLTHYSLAQLDEMASELEIDWEQISGSGKKDKVRNLLLYLYRRNRIDDLLQLMQQPQAVA
jgi:hypothetical protein